MATVAFARSKPHSYKKPLAAMVDDTLSHTHSLSPSILIYIPYPSAALRTVSQSLSCVLLISASHKVETSFVRTSTTTYVLPQAEYHYYYVRTATTTYPM